MSRWWSLHTHSRHSKDDALDSVTALVATAHEGGMSALGLTDHGRMPGVAELYVECGKRDMAPFPGVELYVVGDHAAGARSAMHLTVAAYTAEGYRNLVGLNNLAQQSWFWRNARLDMAQLADLAEKGMLQGLVCATGCRSGPVVKALTERGPEAAEQVVNAIASWFPRVYVELMDHGFTAEGMWDWEITKHLVSIADRQGLPYLITNDAHYAVEADRPLHDALKTLVVHQGIDVDDRKFNGEGYWLVDEAYLAEIYAPSVLESSLANLAELAAANKVKIPELDTFTLKVPDVTLKGTQMDYLAGRSKKALEEWLVEVGASKALTKEAYERLRAELDVVEASGFAGYLAFVCEVVDYMISEGIWFYTRGSATGSFLLFLNKVTQENPLPRFHDIRFDRFLSPDRSSPPDVDIDIEHWRRDEVVQRFASRYAHLQVGTELTYGITATATEEGESAGGSLAKKYYSVQNELKTGVNSWSEVPEHDRQMLKDLADRDLVSAVGAHPGGYVFADSPEVFVNMPLEFINSSKSLVTSFNKGWVEKMGLPKLDLLGSRVLTALRICCNLITSGDNDKALRYYAEIPMEDKETLKRVAGGNTVGLFQFGGWTNKKVLMEYGPTKVKDLIAVQALARPAPMKSGFTKSYMRRRDKVEPVPVMHDDIAAETKDTYGLAIYQEQLVGVLRRLGLDPLRLTRLLKAVKASGKAHAEAAKQVMDEELDSLVEIARGRGWSQADIAWLSGCLQDYGSGYSFGKAHSVQYGCTGYRTGYLAQHEPLAFWTGMLTAYDGVKDQNEPGKPLVNLKFKHAARNDGVKVLGPHVLHSGVKYTPDPEAFAIREGLGSVPYVGDDKAQAVVDARPFSTVIEMCQKVMGSVSGSKDVLFMDAQAFEIWATETNLETGDPLRKSAMSSLRRAGALKGLEHGVPMRKAKGRIRKCKTCKTTFSTPLEYEDHLSKEDTCPTA